MLHIKATLSDETKFEYLENGLGLNIGFSDSYVHINKLSEDIATILELNSDDPTMTVFEQIYLTSGLTFNFTKLLYFHL